MSDRLDQDERVPSVSELRAEARKLEESGDRAAALALYDHVLRLFERSPESVDGAGALYLRVGDLRLDLHQPSRAFASYQQAAEQYALMGSATEIKDICLRMINVVPAAGDVYIKCARRLCEHGHLDSALSVLGEYGRKGSLDSVTDAIDAVGRTDTEKPRRLMDLLDRLDLDTESHLVVARAVSSELGSTAFDERRNTPDRSPAPIQSQPVTTQSRQETSSLITGTRVWGEGAGAGVRGAKQKSSRFHWPLVWGGLGIVVVGIVIFGLTRGPNAEPGGQSPIQSSSMGDASAVGDSNATEADSQPAPSSVGQTSPVDDPTTQTQATSPVATPSNTTNPTQTAAPNTLVAPVVVESLMVRTVSPAVFRGQQGFRVVHLLDSISDFIVESYPVDSASASSYPLGTMIVTVVPPDTAVSIVRFDEDRIVFASGVVPEDSMRVLMGLLRVRSDTN